MKFEGHYCRGEPTVSLYRRSFGAVTGGRGCIFAPVFTLLRRGSSFRRDELGLEWQASLMRL